MLMRDWVKTYESNKKFGVCLKTEVIILNNYGLLFLTHWGRVTHICVNKLTTIGSDNGLSPGWRQAIIWANAGLLLIGPWGTNFYEILIDIHTFSLKKIHLKMTSGKWQPFCLGLNVLNKDVITLSQNMWFSQETFRNQGASHVPYRKHSFFPQTDEIYRCPIFKWVAWTLLKIGHQDNDTSPRLPVMTARQ